MTTSSLYPTHTIICKAPQLSSEFNHKDQGGFSNALQRRVPIGRWVKKTDIEYPFEHGEVNYTLDDVSVHPSRGKRNVHLFRRAAGHRSRTLTI
jgi:hypothetical protein